MDKHGNLTVGIYLMPDAPKTVVDGLYGKPVQQTLKVRINAPPVKGKTNAALLRWLADTLDIPRNSFEVVHGKTARRKQFRLLYGAVAKAD